MRFLALAYAVCGYLLAGAAALYFTVLLFNLGAPSFVPRTGALTAQALIVDLLLIGLFALQHSLMARASFKRWWTRLVPPVIERSTYGLASSLALIALVACWQPLGAVGPAWPLPLQMAMWAITALGGLLLAAASFQIDHFDLMGLRQPWARWRGRVASEIPFQVAGVYRYVRHPLMTGILIVLWAPPVPTLDRLVLAAGLTAYILIALRWEERDLIATFGAAYIGYRDAVPALLPWRGKFRMIAIGEHPEGGVLMVKAQPGARKAGVKGAHGGALKLAVTAPPEDGRANDALIELLHDLLKVKRSQVELIAGPASRDKKFLIRGVPREELMSRVAALLT